MTANSPVDAALTLQQIHKGYMPHSVTKRHVSAPLAEVDPAEPCLDGRATK